MSLSRLLPMTCGAPRGWAQALGVALILAACLTGLGLNTARAGEAASVTAIRLGVHESSTRFVADVSAPVPYTIFTLADPYRLVIDLPAVRWTLPKPDLASRGLIRGVRYGAFRPDRGRIVLDLAAPAKVAGARLLEPRDGYGPRLVIDLAETTRSAFLATAGWPADETAASGALVSRATATTSRAARANKPIIVIDPGHGGVDPGAAASDGTLEKDVTLAFAKHLKEMLNEGGRYAAVLTREEDVTLGLKSRVERARTAGAALFLSLHADALPKEPEVHGLSVYTLSNKASDAEAAALAQKENRADIIAGIDLSGESDDVMHILIDLAQRQTMSEAEAFASALTRALKGRAMLVKNAHRAAGFIVLRAPDVPSVLVELGYLSNAADLDNLRSTVWRQAIAAAVSEALDEHFAARDQRHAGRGVSR
jgi:N-acetylmuramoyl-L-alanine amidase